MFSVSRLGIATRLYAISCLLILGLLFTAGYAWFNLNEVARLTDVVAKADVPQQLRVARMELNVTRSSLQIRHALLVRTPADLTSTLADIGEKRKIIEADLAAFASAAVTPEERAIYDELSAAFGSFWQVATGNIQLIEQGNKEAGFDFLVEKTIPARNVVLAVLAKENIAQEKHLDLTLDTIEIDAQRSLHVLLAAVMTIAVGQLVFSWHIAATLKHRVIESQAVADRVRDGNLTVPVTDSSRDEFSPLLASLAVMQDSLSTVVAKVRMGSESVASASTQISAGNNDLSNRTESQASALQETAASMEELNSTVRLNAENARLANQLAQSASSVASQGGAVVADVVRTMKDINDSSNKIADIIGVIDSIAFQTNILALNAAVEAARAGEQGRGFAVVASEVRSLAGRSATAAREIKALIATSVERVGTGTALVDRAGQTMADVVSSIQKVTDIVAEISAAGSEQSQGVQQVNEAVLQMDQATQQNAALVEEMAAAAGSLDMQARDLVDTVAVFQLGALGDSNSTVWRPQLQAGGRLLIA
ncbi:methyl-accepting chemotaxis protein [Acidovorax sp. LjRoot194]|uniref:methyl-accepting chemotaxis protein n=1 Tax=Acidovorax sp. LjRoot194 TaxID=3342280 RepID=UPI003ECCFE41